MRVSAQALNLAAVLLAAVPLLGAANPPAPPELSSLAPLGGQPGSSFEATIRGKNLKEATRLWSPSAGMTAEVLGVEPGETAKDPDLLRVRLRLAAELPAGPHDLRVITPQGLSNALSLLAHEQPAVMEQPEPHDLAKQAQKLDAWPAVVHGRIAEVGEVDYYSFRVEAGRELLFRTFSSAALDPGVELYELTGSWFDPDRPTRLAFADEPVEYPDEPVETVLRYRFEKAGEYLVRVHGFWGYGGKDHVYALLIDPAPAGEVVWPPPPPEPLWTERTWRRPLDEDRMRRLAGRTVADAEPAKITVLDADAEVTRLPVEPPKIDAPTLIVGSFERPGDIDAVRFSVAEGDKLVFEIQTPEKSLPEINPLLRILDADGVEALTNIWSRVNANGNISKQIYPKTEYAFPRAGDFTLEIRDITASYGGAGWTTRCSCGRGFRIWAKRASARPSEPDRGQGAASERRHRSGRGLRGAGGLLDRGAAGGSGSRDGRRRRSGLAAGLQRGQEGALHDQAPKGDLRVAAFGRRADDRDSRRRAGLCPPRRRRQVGR